MYKSIDLAKVFWVAVAINAMWYVLRLALQYTKEVDVWKMGIGMVVAIVVYKVFEKRQQVISQDN